MSGRLSGGGGEKRKLRWKRKCLLTLIPDQEKAGRKEGFDGKGREADATLLQIFDLKNSYLASCLGHEENMQAKHIIHTYSFH